MAPTEDWPNGPIEPRHKPHTDDFGHDPAQLTDNDFLLYLEDTLIPDLIASGTTATAEDFQRCVRMIQVRDNALDGILEIAQAAGARQDL